MPPFQCCRQLIFGQVGFPNGWLEVEDESLPRPSGFLLLLSAASFCASICCCSASFPASLARFCASVFWGLSVSPMSVFDRVTSFPEWSVAGATLTDAGFRFTVLLVTGRHGAEVGACCAGVAWVWPNEAADADGVETDRATSQRYVDDLGMSPHLFMSDDLRMRSIGEAGKMASVSLGRDYCRTPRRSRSTHAAISRHRSTPSISPTNTNSPILSAMNRGASSPRWRSTAKASHPAFLVKCQIAFRAARTPTMNITNDSTTSAKATTRSHIAVFSCLAAEPIG